MDGEKMKTTIEALILFIKSLPSDSLFEVISFGDYFLSLSDKVNKLMDDKSTKKSSKNLRSPVIEYTDENVEKAIELI
jgi:hypothetical protein